MEELHDYWAWWMGAVIVVTVALTKFADWYWTQRKKSRDSDREDDAYDSERETKEIDHIITQYRKRDTELQKSVQKLEEKFNELQDEHAKCLRQSSIQEGNIHALTQSNVLLHQELERLHKMNRELTSRIEKLEASQ